MEHFDEMELRMFDSHQRAVDPNADPFDIDWVYVGTLRALDFVQSKKGFYGINSVGYWARLGCTFFSLDNALELVRAQFAPFEVRIYV